MGSPIKRVAFHRLTDGNSGHHSIGPIRDSISHWLFMTNKRPLRMLTPLAELGIIPPVVQHMLDIGSFASNYSGVDYAMHTAVESNACTKGVWHDMVASFHSQLDIDP
jgi:hypothetical protein